MRRLSQLWRIIGNISTAAWLYSLLPASALAMITGFLAHAGGHMSPVAIILSALAAFALTVFAGLCVSIWMRSRQQAAAPPEPAFRKNELARTAEDRAAYEMRKLVGGMHDPVAFGARLLEKDREGARDEAFEDELARQRAVIRAKAQMMLDRLATRNHSMMGVGESLRHDSYLAAMWDAEQRGEFYDEFHKSTFRRPS